MGAFQIATLRRLSAILRPSRAKDAPGDVSSPEAARRALAGPTLPEGTRVVSLETAFREARR